MHEEITQSSVDILITPLVDTFNASLAIVKGRQKAVRELFSQGLQKPELCETITRETDTKLQRLTEDTQELEERISMQIEIMESLKGDTEKKLDAYRQSLDSYPLLTEEMYNAPLNSDQNFVIR